MIRSAGARYPMWSVSLLIGLWAALLVYLAHRDGDAFRASLILTPALGSVLVFAMTSNNALLRVFLSFAFIAHAIGTPFFLMSRNNYVPTGFGAVGAYNFDLWWLLEMYITVLICLLAIVAFTRLIDRCWARPLKHVTRRQVLQTAGDGRRGSRNNDTWLAVFIVFVAVPLNWFMYVNRIGITGVEAPTLAFRLTGILYYGRMLLIPLILMWLFSRSTRSTAMTLAVLAYALFSGFSSASRTLYMLGLMPVLLTVLSDRKPLRLAVLLSVTLVGFFLVSASRDSTYTDATISYEDILVNALGALMEDDRISFLDIIGTIANRLYGPQDVVLAFQFEPADPWSALIRYFFSGGVAYSVVPDLGYDVFGMVLPEGTGFGVGMGIVSFLLILGHNSFLRLLVGALGVGLLLSIGNRILTRTSREIFSSEATPIVQFAAVILTFTLYASALNYFYYLLGLLILALVTSRLFGLGRRTRPRVVQPYPSVP